MKENVRKCLVVQVVVHYGNKLVNLKLKSNETEDIFIAPRWRFHHRKRFHETHQLMVFEFTTTVDGCWTSTCALYLHFETLCETSV